MKRLLGLLLALALIPALGNAAVTTTGAGKKPGGGGGGFTLASIQSSLPFWYDVADASTSRSGTTLTSISNLGTVTSATLTETGSQAGTYDATGVGGNPAVVFQNSWPWLQSSGSVVSPAASERHIFVVAKLAGNANNHVLFAVGSNPAFSTQGMGLEIWNNTNGCCIGSAGDLFAFAGGTNSSNFPAFAAASGVASDFTNAHVFEAHLGSSGVSGHIDGTDLGSGRAGSGTGSLSSVTDTAWVGVNPGIENNNLSIAMIVVYDGNDATTVSNIRTLLKTRFSIP